MNFESAVVFDEAKAAELVHEKADSRTGGTYHLRQRLLADRGNYRLGLAFLPEVSQQQERSSESFLAGIEELVYQILLDSNGARQRVGEQQFFEAGLLVKPSWQHDDRKQEQSPGFLGLETPSGFRRDAFPRRAHRGCHRTTQAASWEAEFVYQGTGYRCVNRLTYLTSTIATPHRSPRRTWSSSMNSRAR
jgi:hypothetical protein